MNNKVFDIGINDVSYTVKRKKSYIVWKEMLRRCYCPKWQSMHPTYIGCVVCDEWRYYSKFADWFKDNYVVGYALDKDILKQGNKLYSPQNCCFVPKYINNLLTKRNSKRGKLLIGVCRKTKAGKYQASISKNSKTYHIGYFKTEIEAFAAYKNEKEKYIKGVATNSHRKAEISIMVYDALLKYQVEIND